MSIRALLLGGVGALALAGTASATQFNGWYVGVEGGVSLVQDNQADFCSAGNCVGTDTFDFDSGWAVLATLGYGFNNHWRVELEGGYRANDFDVDTYNSGDLDEISVMANVLYEGNLTRKLSMTVGAGAGVDRVRYNAGGTDTGDFEDRHYQFAAQGIAGFSYELTDMIDLTLRYRYLWVDAPTFDGTHVFAGHIDTFYFEALEKQTVSLGLIFDLQKDVAPAPPPAPPPPPAPEPPPPAPPSQFIVFFGFNKSTLTAEAQSVIAEAAKTAKTKGSAQILVVGHTDTVGSPTYNQRLSERRAAAVKAELIVQGIAEGGITTSGKGETELMVQTGDGVKEPQNRRATIDLQ